MAVKLNQHAFDHAPTTDGIDEDTKGPTSCCRQSSDLRKVHDVTTNDEQAPRKRPDGVSDLTVQAVGRLTHAMETVVRARGYLYGFHELTGRADNELDEVLALFRQAGHDEFADQLEQALLGHNVIDRRWTFQIVDDYDQLYYELFTAFERQARDRFTGGVRHLRESEMKQARVTPGRRGHELS